MITAIRFLLIMTLITGVLYPVSVTLITQLCFPHQANGSLIYKNKTIVGSELIAQATTSDGYFHPRPSAVNYQPASAGSNLSPASTKYWATVATNNNLVSAQESSAMKMASGSGLDPHILPNDAMAQLPRIIKARGWNTAKQAKLITLVKSKTEHPDFRILGNSRVNVLALNLALDTL